VSTERFVEAFEAQRERLLPCVHCGFCLPACPTYNRLGDENDSPRGRLHLMKAVIEGRLEADSTAFQTHIDRCLGCRACEPVCPSGVEYGTLLELARDVASDAKRPGVLTRSLLAVMASPAIRSVFFLGGRIVRGTGLAALGARVLPEGRVFGNARLALAMLASTGPADMSDRGETPVDTASGSAPRRTDAGGGQGDQTNARESVATLTGCVQDGLFGRINDATDRTLSANGFAVRSAPDQGCCGALHAHGGDLEGAKRLARRNIEAFEKSGADFVVVNAAGCGAAMKEYGTLLENDPQWVERARAVASRVRDATELLADAGPRTGAPVRCSVAYDHPCHLLHAQGIRDAPLKVLAGIPSVEVRIVEGAEECCGGAGIYGLTHPELGGHIGRDKVAAVRATGADLACTPNPGCMMQIGAGLRIGGSSGEVVHPVELLDQSYQRAGIYS
jgi:glycolate oxidase iron-sulfur subunit